MQSKKYGQYSDNVGQRTKWMEFPSSPSSSAEIDIYNYWKFLHDESDAGRIHTGPMRVSIPIFASSYVKNI